jgi:ABC-type branched-subunit amino acid transport system ATPase component/predicted MFS family arabinose efflux permease
MSRAVERFRRYMVDEPLFPIAVLCALTWADQVDTQTFYVLGPEIADHFNVGVGIFGTINLFVLLLAPVVALPVAYAADRWKRMPLVIAGAATWAVFSVLTGLAPTLLLLVVFRVGSSSGEVVNQPVHSALIADFYSPRARVKAFGVYNVGFTAGAALGAVGAGVLGELLGWRAPFFLLAIPTIVVLLVALRLPEPRRDRFEKVEAAVPPPFRQTARRLWAVRSLRYQWIGGAFATGSVLGISILVPFFLEDEFGVGPGWRGVITGTGTALSAVAVLAGTAVMQRRLDEKPSDSLRLLCWSGVVAAAALMLMSVAPFLLVVSILIWTVMCVFAFVTPGLRAITAVVAPPELRSTAFAMAGMVALAGSGFALVGFVVGDIHGERWALAIMAPVFLRGVLYFFQAAEYLDDDVERLDPAHVERARRGGPDGNVLLEVSGLTVSYSGVRVLFGVDLEVRAGEIVALLGTNGAGKSTTLNAISGIVEPDGGNVWFEGEAIVGEQPERTVGRGIVQVPGGRGVFPGLTVADNLKMGAFLTRRDKEVSAARLAEVLELFPRLAERSYQRAGSLSGGERQMLTLAQSFLLRPKLLLIDELSLGLAPAVVRELLEAVRRVNATGVAIVLVEQSVNVALTLAHRAYFMEKGEVRFSGPTADLLARGDLLRSVFLEGAHAAVGGIKR